MANLEPKTRITIRVPVKQIKYISGTLELTYEETLAKISEFLTYVRDNVIDEVEQWIDEKVPKRTGQLRHFLKEWLNGSNIYKNVLRIVLGTNLPYAKDVNEMDTINVRHTGQKGYVYYPNIFGIRGPVILNDPQAIGGFFDELLKYTIERTQLWVDRGKIHIFTWKDTWGKIGRSFDKTKKRLGD